MGRLCNANGSGRCAGGSRSSSGYPFRERLHCGIRPLVSSGGSRVCVGRQFHVWLPLEKLATLSLQGRSSHLAADNLKAELLALGPVYRCTDKGSTLFASTVQCICPMYL